MADVPDDGRSAGRLLLDHDFGPFVLARLATSLAIWVYAVTAAYVAYAATASGTAVALVSVAQFVPQLLLAPLSGSWADRGNLKRQMIAGRVVSAAGAGGLAVWLVVAPADAGWATGWAVVVGSVVIGFGMVIGGPAMQSAIPRLVPPHEIATATALGTAPVTIGRIGGPALSAAALALGGPVLAFAVAAVAHLSFVVLAWWVRIPEADRTGPQGYRVRDALGYVRTDRTVLTVLVGVAAIGFGSEPTITLAPAVAAEAGRGAAAVGWLGAAFGIGAASAMVVLSSLAHRIPHAYAVGVGALLMAVGTLAAALPVPLAGALVAFGIIGAGFTVASTSLTTILQVRLDPAMRGRVMALWLMGFLGARPLGALVVGVLGDAASPDVALVVIGVAMAGVALYCRPRRLAAPTPSRPATEADAPHVRCDP